MTTTTLAPADTELAQERLDLLETLQVHRGFLRFTLRGLTDDQARQLTTVSALTLGGLVKHVSAMEAQWADFIVQGAVAMQADAEGQQTWADGFTMTPDDTVAGLLTAYAAVAARTDDLVRTLPDLDDGHELPSAPWFAPGKRWSARRVLVHIVAETSQHAGHADILRESLDGQRTMG